MTVLIDTHVWLWAMLNPRRLNREVKELLEDFDTTIWFSVASSWEIAIKYGKGKLPLPEPPARFIPPRLVRDRITLLPIEHAHALHVADLPPHHRDPFDRLLVAQAAIERVPIVTADPRFKAYPAEVIEAA